jgi:hypothetical protein
MSFVHAQVLKGSNKTMVTLDGNKLTGTGITMGSLAFKVPPLDEALSRFGTSPGTGVASREERGAALEALLAALEVWRQSPRQAWLQAVCRVGFQALGSMAIPGA